MALEITSTETEWRLVPDPKTLPPQRGRVVLPVTIYGVVREPGDVLEMDWNTFRNLCADGRVEPFTEGQTFEEVMSDIEHERQALGPKLNPGRAAWDANAPPCAHQWETQIVGVSTDFLPREKIADDVIFECRICGEERFKKDIAEAEAPKQRDVSEITAPKRGPGRPRKNPLP